MKKLIIFLTMVVLIFATVVTNKGSTTTMEFFSPVPVLLDHDLTTAETTGLSAQQISIMDKSQNLLEGYTPEISNFIPCGSTRINTLYTLRSNNSDPVTNSLNAEHKLGVSMMFVQGHYISNMVIL